MHLTHISRMDFPTRISTTSPFPILGMLCVFRFCSNFSRTLCKQSSNFNRTLCNQTVETLIRRRVVRRLIWVCDAGFFIFHKKDARLIWVKPNEISHSYHLDQPISILRVVGWCSILILLCSFSLNWVFCEQA